LGIFEISIWLFAIGQIMQNLSNLGCYLGFAAGFTTGNFFGVLIERKLAIGTALVRIITNKETGELIAGLKAAEYGVTSIDAQGATGPVKIVLTVIKRKELAAVLAIIKHFDPRAFYSVDEIQSAAAGIFPAGRGRAKAILPSPFRHGQRSYGVEGERAMVPCSIPAGGGFTGAGRGARTCGSPRAAVSPEPG
jgi:uncharacterized protein YebE (UPF0316 family)